MRAEGRFDNTRVVYVDKKKTQIYACWHTPLILAGLDLHHVVSKLKVLHVKALLISNIGRKCNKTMHDKTNEKAPIETALLIVAWLEVNALYIRKTRIDQFHKLQFVEIRTEIRYSYAKHLQDDKVDRAQQVVLLPTGLITTAIGGVVLTLLPKMSSSLYLLDNSA